MKLRTIINSILCVAFLGLTGGLYAQAPAAPRQITAQDQQQMQAAKQAWIKEHPEEHAKASQTGIPTAGRVSNVNQNEQENLPWGTGDSYDAKKKEQMHARGEVVVVQPMAEKLLIDRNEFLKMPKEKQDEISSHPEKYQFNDQK